MLSLLTFNLPILAVALAIGLATGAWIFRGRRPANPQRDPTES